MSQFSVSFRSHDGVEIFYLRGELDAHTAAELEAAFERSLQEGRYRIVVNCAELSYISSAGLGVFMAYVETVRAQGGDIKFCHMSPKIYNIFDLLGFPLVYEIVPTEAEAVARFARHAETPRPE
ncbi:MAG: STAS domain-containing protein [Bacteroidetes bacterium]|nr:STAS domain-containing protein [Rhodothermia bacterium]MCS7154643.1 STAS domain-containing protein [Bacteroidota bacterium]MCX7906360.1 STAS domain-containing protein [Bacteroidota bacterium]MDW8137436.1 STAS domain-containing protein [Bacteroidota bacterium]MDW8285610.1 STAS domain-containing protein [Bacteroidota bacterium]